jgi:predicted MPP superfamily phosphohydrolase
LLLPFGPRYIGDLVALCIVLLTHVLCAWILWRWTEAPAWMRRPGWLQRAWPRRVIPPLFGVSGVVVLFGFLLRFGRVNHHFPLWFAGWGRGIAMTWAFLSVLIGVALVLSLLLPRVQSRHSPARRSFLRAAQGVFFGVPMMVTGYGVFIQRFRISLREEKIVIPGLPPDLDGLRLVQVTDIHLSPFLSEKELARAVDLANEARGHLMLVTGDLITNEADPLDACLAQLSRLRAEAGVFGCNGNHEIYADIEDYIERAGARFGLRMLRSHAQQLRFGQAKLNLAGVDYQRSNKPYLRGAQRLVEPGSFNVLLSHNPDVFPVAARQGYQLTIAGHTHGGQVRVEILHQDLNIARFFTPYVDGLYRLARQPGGKWAKADAEISPAELARTQLAESQLADTQLADTQLAHTGPEDAAAIFVSRGIGTIGLPARIGAPPEVALLHLCRI